MLKVVSEKNGTTHLYQDGKEIHRIKSLSFSHDAMTDKPEFFKVKSLYVFQDGRILTER